MSSTLPGLRWSAALAALLALGACSQNADRVVSPTLTPGKASLATAAASPNGVIISQVYGGGGNAGATLKNDFIELYNGGTTTVSLAGWSVQYASSAGTSWQVTTLSGSIAPGGHYLIQEAAGQNGTQDLPTPNAIGTIPMSGTSAKVALVNGTAALTGSGCPFAANVADFVGYGTSANCFEGSGTTANLSNTTAAIRKNNGAQDTQDNAADFVTGTPNPRNDNGGAPASGPLDHVALSGPSTVSVASSIVLTAIAQDASNQTVAGATYVWSSSDDNTATVDQTGKVTGVAVGGPVTITVTATAGGITRSATQSVTVTVPTIAWIDVTVRSTQYPAGFSTEAFATARLSSGGAIVPATFVFESLDPAIATVMNVNNEANIYGVAGSTTKPRIKVTATPVGGGPSYSFTSTPVTIDVPDFAAASFFGDNDEFGDPTPASAGNPNDLLIARTEYTLSYNESRGTPNWVSYELDSRQISTGQDRCNCFTAEPNVPAALRVYTTDYTNGGFDRGHMTRSADRTLTESDNAATYYMSNVVPQYAALNQGPWAQFETALADSAKAGRAVYIVTGPLYLAGQSLGTLKNEGKVAIPNATWKVALIGPRPGGNPFTLADVQTLAALGTVTVLAVNMPQDSTTAFRNTPWQNYLTTVDAIEAATGYDLLSLLPDNIEAIVESAPAGVKALSMDVNPAQISLSSTASVSVVLYSTPTFDAAAVNAANVRLVVNGGAQVAPIMRGTTPNTSVADVNGDGRPDRLIGFAVSALKSAGFTTGASTLRLQPVGSSPAWEAIDVTPPNVVP